MLGYATLRETQEGSWMFREVSHGHGLQADLKLSGKADNE